MPDQDRVGTTERTITLDKRESIFQKNAKEIERRDETHSEPRAGSNCISTPVEGETLLIVSPMGNV